MAIDAIPFGSALSQNTYGFAAPAALLPWLPSTPRPLPPGSYDAQTTARQRLYYLWSRETNWRLLADFIGDQFAAIVSIQGGAEIGKRLAFAFGQTLDEYGYGLGLPRQGLGDSEYRAALRVRGASIDSSGTIEEILEIVLGLFGEATYTPWYPAAFALGVPSITADQAALAAALLADPIPSGVGCTLVVTSPELAPGWSYSDPATVDTWAVRWTYSGGADGSEASAWGYGISVG
jgi:hypothetical protein